MLKSLLGATCALLCLLCAAAYAQAPPVTIQCGNPNVPCGTATNPLVTTPSGAGSSTVNQGTPNTVGNAWPTTPTIAGTAGFTGGNPGVVTDTLTEAALGTPADAAWSGSGSATVVAALKAIYGKVAATLTVTLAPSSSASIGITGAVSGSAANNLVLKASAGNLYSAYATNLTATAGFIVVLNSTTSPADGAITPLDCAPLPANGAGSINYGAGPPGVFSTGIVIVVTSAATCYTKTTGVITAFLKGSVQ